MTNGFGAWRTNVLKPLVIATAALAIAGSSIVFAQQRFAGPRGDGNFGPRFERWRHLSAEDMAAFADARIAALKAGLELNADQAKNWPALEQALHDLAQLRIDRKRARENADQSGTASATPATPFERLAKRADRMAKAGAALKRVADAGAPLYASLNDAQKNRFKILARMLRPHRHRFALNEGRGPGLGNGPGWRDREGTGGGRRGEWRSYQEQQFGETEGTPDNQQPTYMQSGNDSSEL
jgi:zinc resistance-associated protein